MSDSQVIHEPGGTITVPSGVLEQIVARAAGEVEGARVRRPRRSLGIEVEHGRARVSVELAVTHGLVLPEVARDVQGRIADALREMLGLDPAAVDVAIEELDA